MTFGDMLSLTLIISFFRNYHVRLWYVAFCCVSLYLEANELNPRDHVLSRVILYGLEATIGASSSKLFVVTVL